MSISGVPISLLQAASLQSEAGISISIAKVEVVALRSILTCTWSRSTATCLAISARISSRKTSTSLDWPMVTRS